MIVLPTDTSVKCKCNHLNREHHGLVQLTVDLIGRLAEGKSGTASAMQYSAAIQARVEYNLIDAISFLAGLLPCLSRSVASCCVRLFNSCSEVSKRLPGGYIPP